MRYYWWKRGWIYSNQQSEVNITITDLWELEYLSYKKQNNITSCEPAVVFQDSIQFENSDSFFSFALNNFKFSDKRPAAIYKAMATTATKAARNPNRQYVFLEFTMDGQALGRIVIELYTDICPITTANFLALCTGEKGFSTLGTKLHYKDTPVHRIEPRGWIQAGDVGNGSGAKGESIYGPTFADENFVVEHNARGIVAMANSGLHTNNSQFFINLAAMPSFKGKFVAFGAVVEGLEVLDAIEKVETYNSRPMRLCAITDCGTA